MSKFVLSEGEDPDSFAKTDTLDDLKVYLDSNSKDSIQSLYAGGGIENDPVKKGNYKRYYKVFQRFGSY